MNDRHSSPNSNDIPRASAEDVVANSVKLDDLFPSLRRSPTPQFATAPPGADDKKDKAKKRKRPLTGYSDRYRFQKEPLAVGGMGEIWVARDIDLRRDVAVKAIRPDLLGDPYTYDRFARETRILAMLSHPGICPIYDQFLIETPPCYTMKRVEGKSLADAVESIRRTGKQSGLTAIIKRGQTASFKSQSDEGMHTLVEVFRRVCETVAYAHSRGVIHRDLKPENILIGNFGEVYVMDWGLAKRVGERDSHELAEADLSKSYCSRSSMATTEGQILGTPAYMSPEQAMSQIDALDEKSDIYSLGAILYEILTLEAPVEGRNLINLLAKVVKGDFPRPRERAPHRDIPRELDAIVEKAMSVEKKSRYDTVEALLDDVEAFLEGRPLQWVKYSLRERAEKWVRRHPAKAMGVASAAMAVAIAMVVITVIVLVGGA